MSASIPTEEDPQPTPVSVLTRQFADMQVAERHVADTVMQAASGPSASGITALPTTASINRRVGKQKKHPHLAVTPPHIAEESDEGYDTTQTAQSSSSSTSFHGMLTPPSGLTLPEAQQRVTELYGKFKASNSDVDKYAYMTAITNLQHRVQQEIGAPPGSYNAPPTVAMSRPAENRSGSVQSNQTDLALSQLTESIRQQEVKNGKMFRELGQAMAQANVAVRRLARRTEPQPSIAGSSSSDAESAASAGEVESTTPTTPMFQRPSEPKLQTYDGSVDPRMWMYNCKMRLELSHIAEAEWHKWLLSILTGPAQSYAYYECTEADKTTWVTLYEALKRRFRNKYDGILARDKLETIRLQNSRNGYVRYLQKFREICSQCQPPISAYDQSRYFIRGLPEEYSKDLLLMDMHQFTAIAERGLALHQAAWQAREFASGSRPATQHSDMVMQNFQRNSKFRNANYRRARTPSRHQQRMQRWGERERIPRAGPSNFYRSRSNTPYGSRANTPFRANSFSRRNTTPRSSTPLQKFCAQCKRTNHNTADCWLNKNRTPPQKTSFTKKPAEVKKFRPSAPPAQGKGTR